MILTGHRGYVGFGVRWITTTVTGHLMVYDTGSYGTEYHMLDPARASPNNAATTAEIALAQIWLPTLNYYIASVATGAKCSGGAGSGISRGLPNGGILAWTGGGTFTCEETRFEDNSGAYNPAYDAAARRGYWSASIETGLHKTGLDWIMEKPGSPDTWCVIGGLNTVTPGAAITRGIYKMEFGPLTGWSLDPPTSGTRSVTRGGDIVGGRQESYTRQKLVEDLIPDVADSVRDFAFNPLDGYVYFLCTWNDGSADHVALAAIRFTWTDLAATETATYVDLDPDSPKDYLEITYDSGDANPDLLATANCLAFSPDGKVLYVGNGGDRIFIFDRPPPPGTTLIVR